MLYKNGRILLDAIMLVVWLSEPEVCIGNWSYMAVVGLSTLVVGHCVQAPSVLYMLALSRLKRSPRDWVVVTPQFLFEKGGMARERAAFGHKYKSVSISCGISVPTVKCWKETTGGMDGSVMLQVSRDDGFTNTGRREKEDVISTV